MLTALIVAVLAYALDQLTKYAVESTMQLGDSVTVIPGVLRWHYILNPGAAFSIGEDHTWVFTVIQAVVAVAALVGIARVRSTPWALALGGSPAACSATSRTGCSGPRRSGAATWST